MGDWRVELIYLALPNAEMSKMRVAERVAHGGRDIPVDAIERRFARSLANLVKEYARRVHRAHCYLNSEETPQLVFVQQGRKQDIVQPGIYEALMKEVGL